MNLKEATKIIKKEYPNNCIWLCQKYKNKFIFTVSLKDKFVPGDNTISEQSVDENTGEIKAFDYLVEEFNSDKDDISKEFSKFYFIDITKKQLEENNRFYERKKN